MSSVRPVSGNGDLCPIEPEHGRMWMLDARRVDSRQFCPQDVHSTAHPPEPSVYEHDGKTVAVGPLDPPERVTRRRREEAMA